MSLPFAGTSALAVVALAGVLAGCHEPPARGPGRSLVLVTLDTTRADRIGAFGGHAVPTPVLDALAKDGTIALDATSQVPITLPSHASILTGRYPDAHGVHHNGIYKLRDDEETLAEHLHAAGFETAAFVGAYVLNRGFGTEQGFTTYDDIDVNRFAGGRDQVFEAQRSADDVNARVFPWLAAHAGQRVFLWVHYYDAHEPYAPPESARRALAGEGYDREISYLDACLGDLVSELRAKGFLDGALLAIVGDHGESLGEHGEKTHGLLLYQGALHVPFLLRAPGMLPRGGVIHGPVELVDLAPTVLDYLGVPPLVHAEGRSLRARIEGRDDGRQAQAHAETMMPRLEFGWSDLRMMRDARYKYIRAPRPELYDLDRDPREEHDLAAVDTSRAAAFKDRLDAWIGATGSAGDAARRTLDPDEEARLRSLGYLGGATGVGRAEAGRLVDPKDGIRELRALDVARDELAAGDARGALAGAMAILGDNPRNHQARTTAVLALIRVGDLKQAEDQALKALAEADVTPLVAKARGLLASVYQLEHKVPEAESVYRKLLSDDPANDAASVDLARLLIAAGRLPEADALLNGVAHRDPRNGMALAARFQLATARGDRAAQRAAAIALADARAGDPDTLRDAAALLSASGDPARAAACYQTIVDQSDRPDAELLGKLGITLMQAGAFDASMTAFDRCRALRPSDPRPIYYLGLLAAKRGDAAAAREWYTRALALDPTYTRAAQALASLNRQFP